MPLGVDGFVPPALATTPAALRVLVNPNSPTGTWLPAATVEAVLGAASSVVVIDEAYSDFAPESCIPLLDRHDNWLIVRTFAKSHALAGLRVGYALGHPDLIGDLAGVLESYPVDRLAIAAAAAALGDRQHHARLVELVVSERERLAASLRDAGWEVTNSRANFVFARPPGGDAAEVAAELRRQRILVRRFADQADHLRITVGDPAENGRLLDALGVPDRGESAAGSR